MPQVAEVVPVVVDRFPLHTVPAALFHQLPPGAHRFLLESSGGPAAISAWSFLGHRPFLVMEATGRQITLTEAGVAQTAAGDPFDLLDQLLERYGVKPDDRLPPLCGGLVGYLAYDAGRLIERLPATARNDLGLPEIYLCAYDAVVAVDHAQNEALVVAIPRPGREADSLAAARELADLVRSAPGTLPALAPLGQKVQIGSNFSREAYEQAVARAIEYIYAGDVFQVNLAQRFDTALPVDAWELYRRLRQINPAPFAAYLDAGAFQVVSASPERFLQVVPQEGGAFVETRPIKGTRPRGATPEQDLAKRQELQESLKDRAELNMIVDLERNDLGRVSRFGTVTVPDARRIEAYPTVFHTVATVVGQLRPEVTAGGLLRATFPGGSITGAPKIRAMEIIEELEGVRRGVYCGAIGYLSFSGHIDTNIVIRTIVCRDGRAYFHAGGGIVADSEPAAEYEETLTKAKALMQALLGG